MSVHVKKRLPRFLNKVLAWIKVKDAQRFVVSSLFLIQLRLYLVGAFTIGRFRLRLVETVKILKRKHLQVGNVHLTRRGIYVEVVGYHWIYFYWNLVKTFLDDFASP